MKKQTLAIICLLILAIILAYILFYDIILEVITGKVSHENILFTDRPGHLANKSYIDGETFILRS